MQATTGGTSFLVTSRSYDDFQITAQGTKLIVIMNGMKTVDVDHKGHVREPIALQYGAGTVRFRNVKIRTL